MPTAIRVLIVLLFYFASEQIYVSDRFKYEFQELGAFLGIVGGLCSILFLGALIHIGFVATVGEAFALLGCALGFELASIFITRNMNRAILALIGVPFNIFVIVYYIVTVVI